MRILLVYPPTVPGVIGAGVFMLTEPLALEMLAACLPGHDVRIFDMRLEDSLEAELESFQPHVVGVTALTVEAYRALDVARRARAWDPEVFTIVGGQHATVRPRDFCVPAVSAVCVGEGTATLAEVVAALETGAALEGVAGLALPRGPEPAFTGPRPPTADLDSLPVPDRSATARYRSRYFRGTWKPVASIMTSRGCPHRCSFCSVWRSEDGRYRTRSAGAVVSELAGIEEPYVTVADDNFLQDVRRARDLARRIGSAGIRKQYRLVGRADTIVRHPDLVSQWRDLGLAIMLVGFESVRDEDLAAMNKRVTAAQNREAVAVLRDLGVALAAHFIVDPEFTEDDFRLLGDFVEENGIENPVFCVLTPLPGTVLWEENEHRLTTDNYELFDLTHAVVPTRLPLERFYEEYLGLYERAYVLGGSDAIASRDIMERVKREFLRGVTAQVENQPAV